MPTFLGIDGGGSSTTVRLESEPGAALFERVGPATNPRTVPPDVLTERFRALLGGCPAPVALAACVAGMASEETRALVGRSLREHFPAAVLRFEPDYVAAFHCFDQAPTACVVAGTGSLVCSRSPSGTFLTSGGAGYLLGDEGSAFRLGQRLLARYLADPGAVDALGSVIEQALGVAHRHEVTAMIDASYTPATLIARIAPVLTAAAQNGHAWARELVDAEMASLATMVATHLERHRVREQRPRIGLVGGVWGSDVARDAFERGLDTHDLGAATLVLGSVSPAQAAVALAREVIG